MSQPWAHRNTGCRRLEPAVTSLSPASVHADQAPKHRRPNQAKWALKPEGSSYLQTSTDGAQLCELGSQPQPLPAEQHSFASSTLSEHKPFHRHVSFSYQSHVVSGDHCSAHGRLGWPCLKCSPPLRPVLHCSQNSGSHPQPVQRPRPLPTCFRLLAWTPAPPLEVEAGPG